MVVPRSVRKQRMHRAHWICSAEAVRLREKQQMRDEYHRRELLFLDEKIKKLKQIAELDNRGVLSK